MGDDFAAGPAVVGTCEEMCPPGEVRARHALEGAVMVKKYARRGAGSAMPSPEEIRTLPAIVRATEHVAGLAVSHQPISSLLVDFVCDRFRAIRQDLLLQNCENTRPPEFIHSLQVQTRVLLVFASLHVQGMDPKFVDSQLQACLGPLQHLPEFASYACLLNIFGPNAHLVSKVDDVTLGLLTSARLGLYSTFFSALKHKANALQRMAVNACVWRIQARSLLALHGTCRSDVISSKWCETVLLMSSSDVDKAAKVLRLAKSNNDGLVCDKKKDTDVVALGDLQAGFPRWEPPWFPTLSVDDVDAVLRQANQ